MALSFTQLSALTTNKFLPKVVDNVFSSTAFIKRLTRPSNLRMKDGGISIQGPVIHSEPGASGRWFEGSDTLTAPETDNITAFTLDWKQLQEPVKISKRELNQNKGDSAKLSLIAAKMKIAQKNMTERFGQGLFSDGTADTGDATTKQITGLAAIMSTSATYAGIAVADMATWIANVDGNSGTDRALTLNLMQACDGGSSIDNDKPTVLAGAQAIYDQYWSLVQPSQRIISKEMAGLGFGGTLEFNGKPFIIDSHAGSGQINFINENYVYLVVHSADNMNIESFDKLEAMHGILKRITWMGNLVCDQRRVQGRLDDITV